MNLLGSFLKLIRWPNLLFIALTQLLFKYCIVDNYFKSYEVISPLNNMYFLMLCLASLLIAAAGYIINDYFDLNIDQVNKPDKIIIDKIINRRWAILLHFCLSFTGVILSVFVAVKTNLLIALVNVFCVLVLWYYSTTFKKKLLIGNVVISLLTAWVIFVVYFAVDTNFPFYQINYSDQNDLIIRKIFRLGILYFAFAFIISLIREVIKDMEDINGDAKYGCSTMPIVWGIPVSKVFAAVWLVVLIAAIATLQFYILQSGWWLSAAYSTIFIIVPLLWIIKKLYEGQTTSDYHRLSNAVKFVMLAGILSMIFFKIYL